MHGRPGHRPRPRTHVVEPNVPNPASSSASELTSSSIEIRGQQRPSKVAEGAQDGEVDTHVLSVRADVLLRSSPQVLHRIQLRTPDRQPEQADVQSRRQLLRDVRRVAGISIEQQRERPLAVTAAPSCNERTRFFRPRAISTPRNNGASVAVWARLVGSLPRRLRVRHGTCIRDAVRPAGLWRKCSAHREGPAGISSRALFQAPRSWRRSIYETFCFWQWPA